MVNDNEIMVDDDTDNALTNGVPQAKWDKKTAMLNIEFLFSGKAVSLKFKVGS